MKWRYCLLVLACFCWPAIPNAFAQGWDSLVELEASDNLPLSYPVIGSDNLGGVIGGGSVLDQNYDGRLFWVNAQGQRIWNGSTAIPINLPGDQQILKVETASDGTFIVLINDWPVLPAISHNRFLLKAFNQQGNVLWTTIVRDSLAGIARDPQLIISGNQAIISWRDTRPNSPGIWYQRVRTSDGEKLENEEGRFAVAAFSHAVILQSDDLLIAAADTVMAVSLADGQVVLTQTGEDFHQIQIATYGDSLLVAGFVTTGQILLECFSPAGLSWVDTLSDSIAMPVELNLLPCFGRRFHQLQSPGRFIFPLPISNRTSGRNAAVRG